MDSSALWLLLLAITTPIAGVVGFAIQLRQVRKIKLENEKLLLEITALKAAEEKQGRRIHLASTVEVMRFGGSDFDRPMFSLGPRPGEDEELPVVPSWRRKVKDALILALVLILAAGFLAYALYDLYRFLRWVAHAL